MINTNRISTTGTFVRMVNYIGLLFLTFIVAACGGGNDDSPPNVTPVSSLQNIIVTPVSYSIAAGLTQQFSATGIYSDGTSKVITDVDWSTSDNNLATIGTNGVITTKSVGVVTVTASQGSIKGSTPLTITSALLKSININVPIAVIPKGLKQQLTAAGIFTDGSTQNLNNVTWTSSNTNVAVVDASGHFTAIAEGITSIGASLNGVTGSVSVTVSKAELQSIKVTPNTASTPAGLTQKFAVTGTYSDGSTLSLTTGVVWSSSNTAVATIDNTGLLTAKTAGTSQITATVNGVSGSAALTVTPAILKSITIVSSTPNAIPSGQTLQLSATGTYSDGTSQPLNNSQWTSTNTGIAIVNSVGLVTGRGAGTTTINATLNGVTGSISVTISAAIPVSMQIEGSDSPYVGLSKDYKLNITFSDGTTTLRENHPAFVWSSSNTTVATFTAPNSGNLKFLAAGTVTINATFSGLSATKTVTVAPAFVQELSMLMYDSAGQIATNPISNGLLVVNAIKSDGSNTQVTLDSITSSDPAIVSVSPSGVFQVLQSSGTVILTGLYQGVKQSLTVDAATLQYSYVSGPQVLVNGTGGGYSLFSGPIGGGYYSTYAFNTDSNSNPAVAVVSGGGIHGSSILALSVGTATLAQGNVYKYITVIN